MKHSTRWLSVTKCFQGLLPTSRSKLLLVVSLATRKPPFIRDRVLAHTCSAMTWNTGIESSSYVLVKAFTHLPTRGMSFCPLPNVWVGEPRNCQKYNAGILPLSAVCQGRAIEVCEWSHTKKLSFTSRPNSMCPWWLRLQNRNLMLIHSVCQCVPRYLCSLLSIWLHMFAGILPTLGVC